MWVWSYLYYFIKVFFFTDQQKKNAVAIIQKKYWWYICSIDCMVKFWNWSSLGIILFLRLFCVFLNIMNLWDYYNLKKNFALRIMWNIMWVTELGVTNQQVNFCKENWLTCRTPNSATQIILLMLSQSKVVHRTAIK